jgi:hypothetical protein
MVNGYQQWIEDRGESREREMNATVADGKTFINN